MGDFISRVRDVAASNDIDHIVVKAYASPDGSHLANERLAKNRCKVITDYIIKESGVSPELVRSVPDGIAWDELRQMVCENPDVPSREGVLDILDNVPVWVFDANGKIIDGRKKRLMDLRGGRPYNWLLVNVFPELRNSVAVILYTKSSVSNNNGDSSAVGNSVFCSQKEGSLEHSKVSISATVPDSSTNAVDSTNSALSGTVVASGRPSLSGDVRQAENSDDDYSGLESENSYGSDITVANSKLDLSKPVVEKLQRFALKTNLLYDAALLPNLEFEWLINDRWSVALEGGVAWWYNRPKEKFYCLAEVSPEVRHWLKPRARWHGMYVGAFVGAGLYDLAKGDPGYRGEGVMGGLSFGYMWPVTRNLSFDAEIGAGYMYNRYKEYEVRHGHKVYMLTKSLNYFGPLKLKFSIVWRFDENVKLSKANSTL